MGTKTWSSTIQKINTAKTQNLRHPEVITHLLSDPRNVRGHGAAGIHRRKQNWRGGKGTNISLASILSQVLGQLLLSLISVLTTEPTRCYGDHDFIIEEGRIGDTIYHSWGSPARKWPCQNLNADLPISKDEALSSPPCIWPIEFFSILNPTGIHSLLSSVWARRNTNTCFLSYIPDHKHFVCDYKKWSDYSPATAWQSAHIYKVLALEEVLKQDWFLWRSMGSSTEILPCQNRDPCNSTLAAKILGAWGRPFTPLQGSIQSPPYSYPCCPAQTTQSMPDWCSVFLYSMFKNTFWVPSMVSYKA